MFINSTFIKAKKIVLEKKASEDNLLCYGEAWANKVTALSAN